MSSPLPRIIFYAPSYNSLGGGEIWLNRVANALAERGRQIHVIGKRPPETSVSHRWHPSISLEYLMPNPELQSFRSGMGVLAHIRSSVKRSGPSLQRGWRLMDRAIGGWRPSGAFTRDISGADHERLAKMINDIGADGVESSVVVCTDVYTGSHIARARTAGALEVPFYVMHHNSFDSLNRGTVRGYREAASQAESLVALTEEDAAKFRKSGLSAVVAMPNPRPDSVAAPRSAAESKVVVWMARMTWVKAGDVALRAWARIAPSFPAWQLHLYGDGPERSRLERMVSDLGLEKSVRLCGVTSDPQIVLANSEINLLTSRFEGWALVIGEAAIYSVPTVAANNSPGVRLQIQNGVNGLLVKVGDARGTARALASLMGDEGLRQRLGAGAEVRSAQFDLAPIVDGWDRLLQLRGRL